METTAVYLNKRDSMKILKFKKMIMRSEASLLLCLIITSSVTLAQNEGSNEDCSVPTTFSVFAANTIDGAQLTYKHSSSISVAVDTVLFEGLNISSSNGCGEMYERCSIPLVSWGAITLTALPLGDHFGLVIFNNDSARNQFTFREKHVIDITILNLDCELTSIFNSIPFSDLPSLLAVCFYEGTDMRLLDTIFVELNLTNLASSQPLAITTACQVTNPSNFIFFSSKPTFIQGAVVYVDDGDVWFQKASDGEGCDIDSSVCSDVQRFVPISSKHQAVYCPTETYLLDLSGDVTFPTFSPSVDGVLMFCSSDIYCGYRDNSITLRRVRDKTTLQSPVEFLYGDDVVSGDCVVAAGEFFAVVQLRNGTVIAVNLNQSEAVDLGESTAPPRIFEHSILLMNSSHTTVVSLLDRNFRDHIAGRFLLAAVANGAAISVPCNMSTTPPATPATVSLALPVYAAVLIAVGGLGVLALICFIIVLAAAFTSQDQRRNRERWRCGQADHVDRPPLIEQDLSREPEPTDPKRDPELTERMAKELESANVPVSDTPAPLHEDISPDTTHTNGPSINHDHDSSTNQTTTAGATGCGSSAVAEGVTKQDIERHKAVVHGVNTLGYPTEDVYTSPEQDTQLDAGEMLLIPHLAVAQPPQPHLAVAQPPQPHLGVAGGAVAIDEVIEAPDGLESDGFYIDEYGNRRNNNRMLVPDNNRGY